MPPRLCSFHVRLCPICLNCAQGHFLHSTGLLHQCTCEVRELLDCLCMPRANIHVSANTHTSYYILNVFFYIFWTNEVETGNVATSKQQFSLEGRVRATLGGFTRGPVLQAAACFVFKRGNKVECEQILNSKLFLGRERGWSPDPSLA